MFYKVHTFLQWAEQKNGSFCIHKSAICVPSTGRTECVECYADYVRHRLFQDHDKFYGSAVRKSRFSLLIFCSMLLKCMENWS